MGNDLQTLIRQTSFTVRIISTPRLFKAMGVGI
jgi:hypothetical protein